MSSAARVGRRRRVVVVAAAGGGDEAETINVAEIRWILVRFMVGRFMVVILPLGVDGGNRLVDGLVGW